MTTSTTTPVYWQLCWAIRGWDEAAGEPVGGYGERIEFPGDNPPDWIEIEVGIRLAPGWRQRYGRGQVVLLDDQGRLHTGFGTVAELPELAAA